MKIIQQYSVAINSSNLKDDEHHHHTEVLGAAGLAMRKHSLGVKLFRVKYGFDATSYNALLDEWRQIVKDKSIVSQWPTDISATEVAGLSLGYWLTDVCPKCSGKGFEFVKNVRNVLSDEPCQSCNGTAKRHIEARKFIVKYVTDMVECLDVMILHAGGETMRKLADDMDMK